VVVLDQEPSRDQWPALSFHLRRAYEHDYLSPAVARSDIDYAPRENRHIGMSREGFVSVSHVPTRASRVFEVEEWPRIFQRFYLRLHLHAAAEQLALAQLGHRAAQSALYLESDERLASLRARMGPMLKDMVGYTLTLTGEDSGGPSDAAEFFAAVRRLYRIAEQREELRREIEELGALVQAAYLDEQRAQHAAEQEREQRFQRNVGRLAAWVAPLTVATGLLGMNLPANPFPWGVVALVAAAALVAIWAANRWLRRSLAPPASREQLGRGEAPGRDG
jgi:hypothetical protein